MHFVGNYKI